MKGCGKQKTVSTVTGGAEGGKHKTVSTARDGAEDRAGGAGKKSKLKWVAQQSAGGM